MTLKQRNYISSFYCRKKLRTKRRITLKNSTPLYRFDNWQTDRQKHAVVFLIRLARDTIRKTDIRKPKMYILFTTFSLANNLHVETIK